MSNGQKWFYNKKTCYWCGEQFDCLFAVTITFPEVMCQYQVLKKRPERGKWIFWAPFNFVDNWKTNGKLRAWAAERKCRIPGDDEVCRCQDVLHREKNKRGNVCEKRLYTKVDCTRHYVTFRRLIVIVLKTKTCRGGVTNRWCPRSWLRERHCLGRKECLLARMISSREDTYDEKCNLYTMHCKVRQKAKQTERFIQEGSHT